VDVLGVTVLTVGLTAMVLALIEGNTWGWDSAAVISLIAVSIVALVLFIVVEQRVEAPIIEFALFNSRNFIGSVTVAFIISFAMLGVFFFFALYMQNILGYSALEAGIRFLPTTLVIMVLSPLSGRLADRIGPRWPMVAGMTLISVSLYLLSTIEVGTTFSHILPGFMLLGAGIGMTMSPMSTAAMNSVATVKAGVASGVLSMFRMVGGTFGIAALGALFQAQAQSRLDDTFSGAGLTGAERSDFAHQLTGGAPQVDGLSAAQAAKVTAAGQDAFIYGLSHAMVLSLSMAIIGVLVALVMIRGHGASHDEAAEPAFQDVSDRSEPGAAEVPAPGSAAPVA
ncbi:MAG: MFS transporter, partial [Acidobacteriota bacterium]